MGGGIRGYRDADNFPLWLRDGRRGKYPCCEEATDNHPGDQHRSSGRHGSFQYRGKLWLTDYLAEAYRPGLVDGELFDTRMATQATCGR